MFNIIKYVNTTQRELTSLNEGEIEQLKQIKENNTFYVSSIACKYLNLNKNQCGKGEIFENNIDN